MKILHVVPGLDEPTNGIAVAARLIAEEQAKAGIEAEVIETKDFVCPLSNSNSKLQLYSEVWIHSMWLPMTMKACRKVLEAQKPNLHCTPNTYTSGPRLVRMTHANLDPLRLQSKGWKKLPIWWFLERPLMNRSARVIATCEAEAEWNRRAGVTAPIEVIDLKKCFKLHSSTSTSHFNSSRPLHVLFLGRAADPLKGVRFLQQAVSTQNANLFTLRIVSNHFGDELERDWEWCDVLCLPTLSDNFGLVVAEALERGKRVIVTDGAPAWEPEEGKVEKKVERVGGGGEWRDRLVYLKGYRDGSDVERVRILKDALAELIGIVARLGMKYV